MKTYKVVYGQNLFDVALALYGSAEGVFALMVANPGLGVSSVLEEGDELQYQEDWEINPSIVAYYKENNIIPANGEIKLDTELPDENPFAIVFADADCSRMYMDVSGSGTIRVSWGDGKAMETYTLGSSPISISHWFPDVTSEKTVRMYGDPVFSLLRIKTGRGELRFLREINIQQYSNSSMLKDSGARMLIKNN